jgi:hypothetical protein
MQRQHHSQVVVAAAAAVVESLRRPVSAVYIKTPRRTAPLTQAGSSRRRAAASAPASP